MKRINIYIISLGLLTGIFTGCSDEENFDNKVFVNATEKTTNVLLQVAKDTDTRTFQVAIAKEEKQNVTVHIAADASLVNKYNEGYYDQTEALPQDCYTIPQTEVVIAPGAVRSGDIAINFKNLTSLDREKKYVLPVTISTANIGILKSANTMYFVFKAAALVNVVADMAKNRVYVDWKSPEKLKDMKQITAEALIRPRALTKTISTVMGVEGHFLLRIGDASIASNQLQIAGKKGNFTTPDLIIPTNEWTHVAVTYDSESKHIAVYINGKNKASGEYDNETITWGMPHTEEEDGTRCFWIGYSFSSDRYLDGEICEVRVWNKILTSAEINAQDHFYTVEPSSEGLVAYWKFNEGVGGSIKDYSSNGNDATASSDLKWTPVELPVRQ